MRRLLVVGASVACIAALAGCAQAANESPSRETTAAQPTRSSSPSVTPRPTHVVVDWDSGKGTPQNPEPDPSPRGWYEAAFGSTPAGQGKTLFVTFDDGPGNETNEVLQLLAQHHAKATFFVVGRQVASHPGYVERIRAAGHAVGNHTWDHPDLVNLSTEHVREQLSSTAKVAPGMGHCMRPPYGSIDSHVGRTAVSMGFQPILWTGQAWDWRPPTTSQIIADLKKVTMPGAVILLHDGAENRQNTVDALREMLNYWQQHGYTLKAIPRCFP